MTIPATRAPALSLLNHRNAASPNAPSAASAMTPNATNKILRASPLPPSVSVAAIAGRSILALCCGARQAAAYC